jgi:hypothetical protein
MQRVITLASGLLLAVALNAQTTIIYSSIPAPLPASLISQSFQAGRISEFGNLISFGGTNRRLTSVTVAMVTLGYFSKYNAPGTPNTGGWTDPAITLNLYSVNNSGPNPEPGSVIGSVTQSFFIPWRPEPTPSCGGTLWLAPDGCHNGMAFNITFEFSGLSLTLPDKVIFGIAYNTQSAGQSPTGVNGPYNDLNVGLNPTITVGNSTAPLAYLSSPIPAGYADNGAGGINVFRLDVGGTHTNIAIEFDAPATPTLPAMTTPMLILTGMALTLVAMVALLRGRHSRA